MIRKVTAIVDSDCLIYAIGFGKSTTSAEDAIAALDETLYGLLETVGADFHLLYLTSEESFRKNLYPKYKANRDGKPRPEHYEALRDHLAQVWCAETLPFLEADDLCSLNYVDTEDHTSVVCHIDKDLLQIVGSHYLMHKREFIQVTEYMAMQFFYHQLLMGDSVDNIPGLPGIGEVKAAKLLKDCTTEAELFAVADKAYNDKEYLLIMARLLWLKTNARTNLVFTHYGDEYERKGIVEQAAAISSSGALHGDEGRQTRTPDSHFHSG